MLSGWLKTWLYPVVMFQILTCADRQDGVVVLSGCCEKVNGKIAKESEIQSDKKWQAKGRVAGWQGCTIGRKEIDTAGLCSTKQISYSQYFCCKYCLFTVFLSQQCSLCLISTHNALSSSSKLKNSWNNQSYSAFQWLTPLWAVWWHLTAADANPKFREQSAKVYERKR